MAPALSARVAGPERPASPPARRRRWVLGVVLAVVATSAPAAQAAPVGAPAVVPGPPIIASGSGAAPVPRTVNLAAAGAAVSAPAVVAARPAVTLNQTGSAVGGTLPGAVSGSGVVSGSARTAVPAAFGSARVTLNIPGFGEQLPSCTEFCGVASPTVAAGIQQIVEVVGYRIQAYSKQGSVLCGAEFGTFFGTGAPLTYPHISWDPNVKRFALLVELFPSEAGEAPRLLLAVSATSNACGNWSLYTITLAGALYPAGSFIDYSMLGQDSTALLVSVNNYRLTLAGTFQRINSSVFTIAKSAVYSGAPLKFPAFHTGFGAAPVTVGGGPIPATRASYFLRAIPGVGYQLYAVTNSGTASVAVAPLPVAPASFSAPTRQIAQPGTAVTLNPFDGRIQAPAYQAGDSVWFAHTVDNAGFPTVRYGSINVFGNTVTAALAYKSAVSDDFNPSIVATPVPGSTTAVWLNWAYTDAAAGRGVTPNIAVGQVRSDGTVVELANAAVGLTTGPATTDPSSFANYSAAAPDGGAVTATCPAGLTVAVVDQYYGPGNRWLTRLGRATLC